MVDNASLLQERLENIVVFKRLWIVTGKYNHVINAKLTLIIKKTDMLSYL